MRRGLVAAGLLAAACAAKNALAANFASFVDVLGASELGLPTTDTHVALYVERVVAPPPGTTVYATCAAD